MVDIQRIWVIEIQAANTSNPTHFPVRAYLDNLVTNKQEALADIPAINWQPPPDIVEIVSRFRTEATLAQLNSIGDFLYCTLFPPDPNHPLTQTLRRLQAEAHTIPTRLVLRLLAAGLSYFPWETLYDGNQYLSVQSNLPLVRQITEVDSQNIDRLRKLRVLFITAYPKDLDELKAVDTFKEVDAALRTQVKLAPAWRRWLQLERGIDSFTLEHANEQNLEEALANRSYHIVCFAVHGSENHINLERVNRQEISYPVPTASLLAATTDLAEKQVSQRETSYPILAPRLAEIFKRTASVQMVMFMACSTDANTAQRQNNPLAGFAREFMQTAQIPAVIAMQSDINDNKANMLTTTFFRSLSNFQPVDRAFALARKSLITQNRANRDMVAPVMYLQTRKSHIFQADRLRVYGPALAIILVLLALMFAVYFLLNSFRIQILSEEQIALETQKRVQQLGQSSQFETIRLDYTPSALLRTTDAVWFTEVGGRYLHRRDIRNPHIDNADFLVDVGNEPSPPVSDGQSIWVTSRLAGMLTRIDPTGLTPPEATFIAYEVNEPLVSNGGVWMPVPFESALVRYDVATGELRRYVTDLRVFEPIVLNDDLWVLPHGAGRVLRVNMQTLAEITFNVEQSIEQVFVADGRLWVLNGDNTLQDFTTQAAPIIQLDFTPGQIVPAADSLFFTQQGATTVYRLSLSDNTITEFLQLEARISWLHIRNNHLFIFTDASKLHIFDMETVSQLGEVTIFGLSNLENMVDAGTAYWIPVFSSDALVVIDKNSGAELQTLSLCNGPAAPLYDGSTLWISCLEDNSILFGPATMYYFGAVNQRPSIATHTPLRIDNLLWIVQPGSGDLIIYDYEQRRMVDIVERDGLLLPLVLDAEQDTIWTVATTDADSTILRIRLQPLRFTDRLARRLIGLSELYRAEVSEHTINAQVQAIHLVDDDLWIQHNHTSELMTGNNLTILNRQTMAVEQEQRLGVVTTGFYQTAGRVWISASGQEEGLIYEMNPVTGATVGEPFAPDDLQWSPSGAQQVGDTLYFPFGAPTLNGIGEFIIGDPTIRIAPLLYPYNLMTNTWGEPLDLVTAAYNPVVDDPFIWFSATWTPIIGQVTEENAGTVYRFDTRSQTGAEPLQLCKSTGTPYITSNFVWIGCAAPDETLFLFDRASGDLLMTHENMGSAPQQPLEYADRVLMTFRDTHNAVVFDAQTGMPLRICHTGANPSAPFLLDDTPYTAWSYSNRIGTLQQIQFNP
jgi:hypothetical protein